MSKIQIIGDCHVSRVYEHYDKTQTDLDIFFWGRRGERAYDVDFQFLHDDDIFSSGIEQSRGIDYFPEGFSNVVDDGLVFIWIGYVDIRQNLPKYKNADKVAKTLIRETIKFFKNARVILVEPLPQFYEMILKYEGISPSYTYEERQIQNQEFLDSLHKYAAAAGLTEFITQKDIYEAIGVDMLTEAMTHNDAPHPVDGLKPEYMKMIYDLFVRKAQEALDSPNL